MNTTILIKLNKDLKVKAQKTAKDLGLPMSTVISNYLKDFIEKKEVTFSLPKPNSRTVKDILEARKDCKINKNISPEFKNSKEAISYLKKYS